MKGMTMGPHNKRADGHAVTSVALSVGLQILFGPAARFQYLVLLMLCKIVTTDL